MFYLRSGYNASLLDNPARFIWRLVAWFENKKQSLQISFVLRPGKYERSEPGSLGLVAAACLSTRPAYDGDKNGGAQVGALTYVTHWRFPPGLGLLPPYRNL